MTFKERVPNVPVSTVSDVDSNQVHLKMAENK